MNLQSVYQEQLSQGRIRYDSCQEQLIRVLETFSDNIHNYYNASLFDRLSRRHHPGHIYIWGPVGRGKTMLMDILYNQAEVTKQRFHFGSFMRWLHEQLNDNTGSKNPLKRIAKQVAHKVQLLCFDEFQVLDIGDAMLLATLLEHLLAQPITICITSNVPPADLYKNGLQRSRFVPAITLLEHSFHIVSLNTQQDYRRLHLAQTKNYYQPLTASNSRAFFADFDKFATSRTKQHITINGRSMLTLGLGADALCVDFATLCRDPRSSADYLEICERFRIVFLANLVRLKDPEDSDAIRRLINLIDQLYDNRILLACLSEVPVDNIYTGSLFAQPFERCHSRLSEMQSNRYQQLCLQPFRK